VRKANVLALNERPSSLTNVGRYGVLRRAGRSVNHFEIYGREGKSQFQAVFVRGQYDVIEL
jgi:hypothetical protein